MYWLLLSLALCIVDSLAISAVCPLLSHLLIHLLYTLHCKLYNNNNNNNNNRFHILSHQPPHLVFFQVLTSAFFLGLVSEICSFTFEVAAICLQNTTCFCTTTGPYSQLSNFYIYNLNSAAWFTFPCQYMQNLKRNTQPPLAAHMFLVPSLGK